MKKRNGIKVSRVLAITETTSRQSFKSQLPLFAEYGKETPESKLEELQRSLFTFTNTEAVVYDGLCKLCMDAHDKEHIDLIIKHETGVERRIPVIGRQEETTETHYRSVLSLDEAKIIFCGKYQEYWDYVLTEIKRLAYDPPKKRRLVLGKKIYIDTEPLRIDFVYEDGSGLRRIANLSPRRKGKTKNERELTIRNTGKAKGEIVGFVIEFYKPLFLPIIEDNKKKTRGKAFIRQPPFFHLGIIDEIRQTVEELKTAEQKIVPALKKAIYDGVQSGAIFKENVTNDYFLSCIRHLQTRAKNRFNNILGISPVEMRNVFNYLALHDNGKGEYITIKNLTDFASRCFEGLTDLDRTGKLMIYSSRFKELIEQKLMPILYIYKNMMRRGKMDGGQLVPCNIVFEDKETGEKFGRETNSLRIECLKSRSFYSAYTKDKAKDELVDLAGTVEIPQITAEMLGKSD